MSSNKYCEVCKKKITLIPIVCECGQTTCLYHRFPRHSCSVDRLAKTQETLREQYPVFTKREKLLSK